MEGDNADIRVGDRLRVVLKYRGQSLRSFSAVTGIPYRTLQDHVANKSKPNADQLATMANYGININFLLTGSVRGFASNAFSFGSDISSRAVLGDDDLIDLLEDIAIDRLFDYEFGSGSKDIAGDAYRKFLHILLQTAIDMSDIVLPLKGTRGGTKRVAEIVSMAARPSLDRCYNDMKIGHASA